MREYNRQQKVAHRNTYLAKKMLQSSNISQAETQPHSINSNSEQARAGKSVVSVEKSTNDGTFSTIWSDGSRTIETKDYLKLFWAGAWAQYLARLSIMAPISSKDQCEKHK